MFNISFDYNSIVNAVSFLLIILTTINYVLSIKVNRKQRKKLEELEKMLEKLHKV